MTRTVLAVAVAFALSLPALAADEPTTPGGTAEKVEKPVSPDQPAKNPKQTKSEEEKPKSEFGALKFRAVGPAITGRVDRVSGVPGDPRTYYAAFAQGGVWKTENGGHSWKPIFDDQPTNSIGSIAVAPSDPNVLYVGSGEANIRGNVAFGSGIFKSGDAGKSWKQVWKTRGQIGISEQAPDLLSERLLVTRVLHEQPALFVLDLIQDAADGAGDDRTALPHRLDDSQTEALLEAFLDYDAGMPLDGIHHYSVLVRLVHRQRGDVDARSLGGGQ